jgi:hypothetical protein
MMHGSMNIKLMVVWHDGLFNTDRDILAQWGCVT